MKKGIIAWSAIIFVLALTVSLFAGSIGGFGGRGGFNYIPAPRLLSPITDDVDLSGKEFLEFKWTLQNPVAIRGYDFRLYKGYNTSSDTLVFKQQIEGDVDSFQIKSSELEINQVYTWKLRAIGMSGVKSDSSFSPFKIVKR